MILIKYLLAGLGIFLLVSRAVAGEVSISDAWARATAPGQDSAAVAMHITSQKEASIIAVSSADSKTVEIHSMSHENGMMKMRALEVFPLKARQEVALGSDGNHIMLIGLKKPLKEGDSVKLTLTLLFADKHKEAIEVKAVVKPMTEQQDNSIQY
jgi:copper(I)-binding protein